MALTIKNLRRSLTDFIAAYKIAGGLWFMAMVTVLVAAIAWLVISVVWTNDCYAFSKGAREEAGAGSVLLAN